MPSSLPPSLDALFLSVPDFYPQVPAGLHPQPLQQGHIHDTWRLGDTFILQRFNEYVFPNADMVAANHRLLRQHENAHPLPFSLALPFPNREGALFTRQGTSLYRISPFFKGPCLEKVKDPALAENLAAAFARFAGLLGQKQEEIKHYQEVIPDFHHFGKRFQHFLALRKSSQRPRSAFAVQLIEQYAALAPMEKDYLRYCAHLPQRLTHNDAKITNVILDKLQLQVQALLDLDTVMPGYVLYDFGDLVRTVASTVPEDSTDWERVGIDATRFDALLKGYRQGGADYLTAAEQDSLLFGAQLLPALIGLRFLSDWLEGDRYFKVKDREHNLRRAQNQWLLYTAIRRYLH
ncbi:MAG: phosphotransferase enzyme family protein [Nitritalea sp.]